MVVDNDNLCASTPLGLPFTMRGRVVTRVLDEEPLDAEVAAEALDPLAQSREAKSAEYAVLDAFQMPSTRNHN